MRVKSLLDVPFLVVFSVALVTAFNVAGWYGLVTLTGAMVINVLVREFM